MAFEIKYISDLHFFHRNVARYDNRPWQDTDVMNAEMIRLWNEHVDPTDIIYILGDVVWSKKIKDWTSILEQLNGSKRIIKGNHDQTQILNQLVDNGTIQRWEHQEIVQDPGKDGKARYVILNHSPMPFFVNMHHDNSYHLYGHVHISFDYQIIKHVRRQIEGLYQHPIRMFNVGCMIRGIDYVPRTLDEIIQIDAENRKFEEGHEEDYLLKTPVKGHDKIGLEERNNR